MESAEELGPPLLPDGDALKRQFVVARQGRQHSRDFKATSSATRKLNQQHDRCILVLSNRDLVLHVSAGLLSTGKEHANLSD